MATLGSSGHHLHDEYHTNDTCKHESCKLHDLLGGTPDECPNYVESWWKNDRGETRLVKDCAPKRTLLMIQELYNQQIRLQCAQDEQRNSAMQLTNIVARGLTLAADSRRIKEGGEFKQITGEIIKKRNK